MQSDGSKLILDTELLECAALTGFNNNLCNSTAETADDVVILNGDYAAGDRAVVLCDLFYCI